MQEYWKSSAPTPSLRVKLAYLTVPWMYDCNDLLFAVHDDTANINAIVKPFQWPVGNKKVIRLTAHCVINFKNILLSRSGWEC
jgi:ionotropic glutamate receptor